MSFSKKGKVSQESAPSNHPQVDWSAYNAHILEKVLEATDNGDSKNQVCFISGVVDTGTQPAIEPYTVYDADIEGGANYEKQQKLISADFGCFIENGKFHIPQKPVDSVVFFVDFPEILIDYGKFFGDGDSEPKPYRTLLAGEWDGVATYTSLQPSSEGYGGKSRISVLAKATGCTKGNPPSNFDIAELLGKPFTMDVAASTGGDKNQYVNIRVSSPSSKHKAIPFPDHTVTPFGVGMNSENSDEAIKQIFRKSSLLARLALAEEWETSKLKAQIAAMKGDTNSESETSESQPEPKAPTKAKVETVTEVDPFNPFDDDIPY